MFQMLPMGNADPSPTRAMTSQPQVHRWTSQARLAPSPAPNHTAAVVPVLWHRQTKYLLQCSIEKEPGDIKLSHQARPLARGMTSKSQSLLLSKPQFSHVKNGMIKPTSPGSRMCPQGPYHEILCSLEMLLFI